MKLVVFTDLDGTLLDHYTYDYRPALPALEQLKALGAGVVLASSKTWAEMAPLHQALGLTDPLIAEGGAGIFVPPAHPLADQAPCEQLEGGWRVWSVGRKLEEFADKLEELKRRHNARGFTDMDTAEIARITGLSMSQAERAAKRLFSEPVSVAAQREQAFMAEAEAMGLSARKGGRFVLVSCGADKGRATQLLLDYYRRGHPGIVAVGLGDAPNDEPMLARVDIPVLLARADGGFAPLNLCGLRRISPGGPQGWNKAIETILREFRG